MKFHTFPLLLFALGTTKHAICARVSETNPPPNTIIVRPGGGTLSAAFQQLQGRKGKQVFLLMPGAYFDNALLQYYNDGVIIQGVGGSAISYSSNRVTITSSKKGLDAASALAITSNNVEVYNIDFINNYGSGKDTQAVALTAAGDNQFYGQCSFKSFQDTLYDKQGTHVFNGCYIEGAVDFIFGGGRSWYNKCHIAIRPSQWHQVITANKGGPEYPNSLFVFNFPTITDLPGVAPDTTFYGRAWGPNPRVCFQYANRPASLNSQGWDMKSAGGIPFSSDGFYEFPTIQTAQGHRLSRAYTTSDVI
ncbi:hypothetical protein CROQUDRAFT_717651 [Cronartium quercuum f. sp. fusiforme G11]|uniref:Pectinesterase n=1 Tax=Cronartium quercuum f. sp. fusiforme G11 TaxID=708437 RepID=A0A9P6T7Z7_9BASI|nr:hypothetical protein CROQUDRAFT_717651 [Cronartium quercuum f. sp. fusiforme G11]